MLVGFCAVAVYSLRDAMINTSQVIMPQAVFGWWFQLLLWLVAVLYFALFWWHRGQTPGMSAWRIIVCDARQNHLPRLTTAMLRALLAPVSAACFGAGYLYCLFSSNRVYWHDIWSHTRILRVEVTKI